MADFKFDDKNRTKYYTCKNYLAARCKCLASKIESQTGLSCLHDESSCHGMSNYLTISDDDGNCYKIRISDHKPTRSGSQCDYYINIIDRTWREIKSDALRAASDFKNNLPKTVEKASNSKLASSKLVASISEAFENLY